MAKHDPYARQESRPVNHHLHHAGVKGAASLLHKHGHIDEATRDDIVAHADRNMKKGKRK